MGRFVFLIPLFPLLGFLFNFTVGVRVLGRKAHDDGHGHGGGHGDAHGAPSPIIGYVACGAVALSFLVSLYAIVQAHGAPGHTLVETLWTWIPGGAAEAMVHGTPGTAPFHGGLGLPGRPALLRDAPGRDLRGLPHPRLLDGVHGARPRVRALHVVPEPLHVRDAHARPGRELRRPLRGLGGRRPLLVPADRVLVRAAERVRRGQEGLHREPHRGRGLPARDVPRLRDLREPRLPDGDGGGRGTCPWSGRGAGRSP